MQKNENRSLFIWLISGCVLIATMVVIGGITRLTHSGLSMVEWKLIMGSIPPLNEEQWIETFEKYKQFPEYKIMHNYFTLEDFKSIFMWEYIHRLLGRIIGLVFIIPLIIFWIKGQIPKNLWPQLILIFLWGGFQGILGWFMVKSGLVNDPNVSHYRLAIHLVTAFGLCCYILWVALNLRRKSESKGQSAKPVAWLFVLTLIQIVYGAFVAGLKAGYIHTTWPKMSNHWIDPNILQTLSSEGIMALLEDPVTVQFVHRWTAFLVLAFVFVVFSRFRLSENAKIRKANLLLLTTALIQVSLGIITLVFAIPITVAVLHQLVALLLLLSAVNLYFEVKRPQLSA